MKGLTKNQFRWIKIIVAIYALVGIAFYYLQEKIIFHPWNIPISQAFDFKEPFVETNLRLDEITNYNLVQFKTKDSIPKGVVLYFHGNKGNINRYAKFAKNFTRNGYEVWMIDYPKFGKSTGELSENNLQEMALQLYKLARVRYEPTQIVLYGKSLGTGIAAQLASIRDCKQLILETPYNSMVSLVRHYAFIYPVASILKYKLLTNSYLPKVTAPICIFHGTDDALIPLSNAAQLKTVLKPTDLFVTLEKGTHHNLNDFPQMQHTLDSLLQRP
jgi:alpha-beta hydrolase superfamily lysophospholipase